MRSIIITRGATLEVTYSFYEAKSPYKRIADKAKPINLSGFTIAFVVRNDQTTQSYQFTSGITVSAAEGRVDVQLSPAQTSSLPVIEDATAFLQLTDGSGNVFLRAARHAEVRS